MNVQTPVILGTQVVSAAVVGAGAGVFTSTFTADWAWVGRAVSVGAVIGLAFGQRQVQKMLHPNSGGGGLARVFEARMATNKQPTIINLFRDEHTSSRIVSDIPVEYWQAVAKVVVEWQSPNLTTQVIKKALPSLVQDEQRAVHNQMVGLLSTQRMGVIAKKNNHNEITYPVGRSFFARVSVGRVSPLRDFLSPTPHQSQMYIPDNALQSTHTPRTRGLAG